MAADACAGAEEDGRAGRRAPRRAAMSATVRASSRSACSMRISYNPEPHNGHKVRVTGYMVRLGAEIRVNVQSLQMVGASCGN